jgi:hypothetical protein
MVPLAGRASKTPQCASMEVSYLLAFAPGCTFLRFGTAYALLFVTCRSVELDNDSHAPGVPQSIRIDG